MRYNMGVNGWHVCVYIIGLMTMTMTVIVNDYPRRLCRMQCRVADRIQNRALAGADIDLN
jgi:hypothetical protein